MCVLMRAFGGSSGVVSCGWSRCAVERGAYISHHVRGDIRLELKLDDVCDSHGYCSITY